MNEVRQEVQVPIMEVPMDGGHSRVDMLRRNFAGISLSALSIFGVSGFVGNSVMSPNTHGTSIEQTHPRDAVTSSYIKKVDGIVITVKQADFTSSAKDFVKEQSNFVTPEHIQGTVLKHRIDKKGKSVEVNDCFKMPNGWFWNSYYDAAGKLVWFKDSNPGNAAWACKEQITVNGKKQDILEKIRGGMYAKQDGKNGDCGNEVKERQTVKKAPTPLIVGKIIVEQSLNSFINITATSSVKDMAKCSTANGSAEAEAEASAKAVIQIRENAFINASSSTKNKIFSTLTGHSLTVASTEVTGKAIAVCKSEGVDVATKTTTPPKKKPVPVVTTTQPPVTTTTAPAPTTTVETPPPPIYTPPTETTTTTPNVPTTVAPSIFLQVQQATEAYMQGTTVPVCVETSDSTGTTPEVNAVSTDPANISVGQFSTVSGTVDEQCAEVGISNNAPTTSNEVDLTITSTNPSNGQSTTGYYDTGVMANPVNGSN